MAKDSDLQRLKGLFGRLRDRLLDLSSRNPLVSYKHRPTSKRQLRFVDAVPDLVYANLVDETAAIQILPLPEPAEAPMDERTAEFISHLEHAKSADAVYLTRIQELENSGADGDFELALAERELRDRVRTQLGLSPRPSLRAINASHHAETLGIDPSFDLPSRASKDVHEERALQTLKWPDTLEAVLEKIADDARLAEQEMGLSTLFLVFGFLEWFEADSSDKHHTAPLLLLPVKLEKKKTTGRKTVFNLSTAAEAPEINLSLKKRIERDFNRLLPEFTADEEAHQTVENYLAAVQTAIEGQKRWRVRRQLTLGHFAFGRLAMYAELEPDKWQQHPAQFSLVRSVLSGCEMSGNGGSPSFAPPEDYAIDDPEIEQIAPHLIHDADASQHSALIDVMEGKNLVIQGPPGTGKSQTITNVVANVLANGGTVLFLAEKLAALEVVKRRMDKAKLGEFCLELHSDRAASRRVIESLKARHAIGYGSRGQAKSGVGPAWREARSEIADYLAALHRPLDGGTTTFTAMWESLRARSREQLQLFRFADLHLPDELLRDAQAQARLHSDLSLYSGMLQQYVQRFGSLESSPWSAIEFGETVGPGCSGPLLEELKALHGLSNQMVVCIQGCSHWRVTTSTEMANCVAAIGKLPTETPTQPMLDALGELDRSAVRDLIDALRELIALEHDRNGLLRLNDADAALLSAIEKTAELGRSDGETRSTAAALRQSAECSAREFGRLFSDLEDVAPIFRIAGISGGARGAVITALGLIAELFSQIPREYRGWALSLDDEKAGRFDQIFGIWERLAEAEAEWRGRFPSFSNQPWHSPAELHYVAGLLRKRRFARILGVLSGDRQAIDQLAARLSVPTTALPGAAELEEMASHVQELTAFEANRSYRQFLGPVWAGLDTPFDELRRLRRNTLGLFGRVLSVEGGAALLKQLKKIDASALDCIVDHHGRLARLAELPVKLREVLATNTIDEIFEGKRRADDRVAQLMAADPAGLLLPLQSSIEQLAEARQLELKRRTLVARIQCHALPSLISMLTTAPAKIECARAALDWLDAAEDVRFPHGLRDILVKTVAEIDDVRSAAVYYANANTQLCARLECLGQQYGMQDLLCENGRKLVAQLDSLLAAGTQLKEVLELRDQRRRLAAAAVDHVLRRAKDVGVAPQAWCALLAALIATAQAQNARRTDAALRRASGLRLEAQRKAFVAQDRDKKLHDREALRNAVRAVRPPTGTRSGSRKTWTEMQLILNEFAKERKFVPVRDLIARAGKAMLAMKPCFMMSPLSLAKFLPPGSIEFDLLVIDEASQMRPEDALGGMLRAKQVVVVGDQKQLPPTDFFNRSGGDDATGIAEEEDFEDVDDESILEACQKTFNHARMLRWHYRSRCESLIAFSNSMFYGNELITFPTARPGSFSVELRKVQGAYEARRNPPEAQQIVADAIAFMREHADDQDDSISTIGIVAINTQQRDLISEEFRMRASRDERIERYREKTKARGEEFFIKNLENVQGDERDVILISLTYGPKPGQKTPHQRFGPINGKHGHRRLNVLFSRARDKIVLFTSLEAHQIVASPGGHLGVNVLKQYLAYAEAGGQAVPDGVGAPPDSDFEIEVRDRLQRRGYAVDTQVGVSGYRIDLGVRNPDRPQSYLAGVECDGASYHGSKSARDRDRLRQDCLNEKGWEILRVWSTDWFDDPDGQTEKLVKQLEELRTKAAERIRHDEARRAERAHAVAALPGEDGSPGSTEQDNDTDETACAPKNIRQSQHTHSPSSSEDSEPSQAEDEQNGAEARPDSEMGQPTALSEDSILRQVKTGPVRKLLDRTFTSRFTQARVADCGIDPNADRFYEPGYGAALRCMVAHVIAVEGPLYRGQLVTRIARAHGFQRNGPQIEKCVCDAIESRFPTTTEEDGKVVYWPEGAVPGPLTPFRVTDQLERDHASIPLVELASLARHFLVLGVDDEAAMEAMKDHFRLGRLREATRKRFGSCIEAAKRSLIEPTDARSAEA